MNTKQTFFVPIVIVCCVFILFCIGGYYLLTKTPDTTSSEGEAAAASNMTDFFVEFDAAAKRSAQNFNVSSQNAIVPEITFTTSGGATIVTLDPEKFNEVQSLLETLKPLLEDNPTNLQRIIFEKTSGEAFDRSDFSRVFNLVFPEDVEENSIGDEIALYLSYENNRFYLGASITHNDAPKAFDFLAENEDAIFTGMDALIPQEVLRTADPKFSHGTYKVHKTRYYNFDTILSYSLDYTLTDQAIVFATSQKAMHTLLDESFSNPVVLPEDLKKSVTSFGAVTLSPDITLDGPGENIDSPEFWLNPSTGNLSLYVSAKKNDLIEIWSAPFAAGKFTTHKLSYHPNGLAVDTISNILIVADTENKKVDKLQLPSLSRIGSIGKKDLDEGENNVAVMPRSGGSIVYASQDNAVYGLDINSGDRLYKIKPSVEEIEEVLTDPYYQVVYVPDEQGSESKKNPGGVIQAFHLDGRNYVRGNASEFGRGKFTGDAEGVALYRCLTENKDTGNGFMIFANQVFAPGNTFEFFDRKSWKHLGSLTLTDVTGTDGIASLETPTTLYPDGVFAAINNDYATSVVSWTKIFDATGLSCNQ